METKYKLPWENSFRELGTCQLKFQHGLAEAKIALQYWALYTFVLEPRKGSAHISDHDADMFCLHFKGMQHSHTQFNELVIDLLLLLLNSGVNVHALQQIMTSNCHTNQTHWMVCLLIINSLQI